MSNILDPVSRISSITVTLDPRKIFDADKAEAIKTFQQNNEEVTLKEQWMEIQVNVPVLNNKYFYVNTYNKMLPSSITFPDEETYLVFSLMFKEYVVKDYQ